MNIHQILLGAIVGGASAGAFYSRAREEEKLYLWKHKARTKDLSYRAADASARAGCPV